jgi:glycosyltransferase involved in cell wall biosynthesis
VAEFLRNVFPLWCIRSHPLIPEADKHIIGTKDGIFTPVGTEPIIQLPLSGSPLKAQWIRFRVEFKAQEKQSTFLLYHRTGEGFSPINRNWLILASGGEDFSGNKVGSAVKSGGNNDILLRVPRGVVGFRLDPFSLKDSFQIKNIRVSPLGSVQLIWYLVRTRLLPELRTPLKFVLKCRKALAILKKSGVRGLLGRFYSDNRFHDYPDWVRRYDTLDEASTKLLRQAGNALPYQPKFSVIMPTYNTPLWALSAAIESVKNQTYPNWELCIADDASTDPRVKTLLAEHQAEDARIRVCFRSTNGHISVASNDALSLAQNEFVGFLDHDDLLAPYALFCVAEALNRNPDLDFIYSDEDKIDEAGNRLNPYFKPDWSPELYLSQNYTTHFSVYRRALIKKVGGFRAKVNGAQDWDLTWRVIEQTSADKIHHIPRILYHWRLLPSSTAQSTSAKPYVLAAQKQTIVDHLKRTNVQGTVDILSDLSNVCVKFALPDSAPQVSIIIPTKDQARLLEQCIRSIYEKTSYKNFDITIVDNCSSESETFDLFKKLKRNYQNIKILPYDQQFNFSRINNIAVESTSGSLVAFLNNDIEVIKECWLAEMVKYAVQPEIGIVGARLLYPNQTLQHGGVILGIGGVAGHSHKGRPRHDVGYFNRLVLPINVSATTAACMVMRRVVFKEAGGFNEKDLVIAFNDVDLCLKVGQLGYRIVVTPHAELYHHESISRGYEDSPEKVARFEREKEYMLQTWGKELDSDPFYNPNLSGITEDYAFSFPPRQQSLQELCKSVLCGYQLSSHVTTSEIPSNQSSQLSS